jgi:hypothetical protein
MQPRIWNAPAAQRNPADVAVHLRWNYTALPARMQVYDLPADSTLPLWHTATAKATADLPVGSEVASGDLSLKPGETRRFALVLANPGSAPLYFFAAPHHATPPEHSLGFQFRCLCLNHAFSVSVGEIWYRIVQLKLIKGFEGRELTISHDLVGIDVKRYREFDEKHQDHDH